MKSRKVKKIGATVINAIKVLENQSVDGAKKQLLAIYSTIVKDIFDTTECSSELINMISKFAEKMKSSEIKLNDYESFILYSTLNWALESLSAIGIELNQIKNEPSKYFSRGGIKNILGSVLNSSLKEKEYDDFLLNKVVLMDNIACLPMFFEILKKGNDKILSKFIDFSDEYVYGIIYNGRLNENLKMCRPILPKSSSYKYARMHPIKVVEYTDIYYRSYYLFRVTKSSINAANDICTSRETDEFIQKYPYENKTACLSKYKPLAIAEIYMRAIENELPAFAHVRSTVLGLKVEELYI